MNEILIYRRTVEKDDIKTTWNFIPKPDYNGFNYINGEKITYDYNDNMIVYVGEISRLHRVILVNNITHYKNNEEIMSIDDYNKTISTFNIPNEDGEWESIDDEFACRKFISLWKAVSEVKEHNTDYDFRIIDLGSEEIPPYTTPHYMMMGKKITNAIGLYTYCPKAVELFEELALKHGFIRVDTDSLNGTYGAFWATSKLKELAYSKLNGSYIPDTISKRNWSKTGTASECLEQHKENVRVVEEYLINEKAKMSTKILDKNTIGSVIKELNEILIKTKFLDCKQKSISEQNSLYKKIEILKNILVNEANSN